MDRATAMQNITSTHPEVTFCADCGGLERPHRISDPSLAGETAYLGACGGPHTPEEKAQARARWVVLEHKESPEAPWCCPSCGHDIGALIAEAYDAGRESAEDDAPAPAQPPKENDR